MRVIRVIQYEGTKEAVERTLKKSIKSRYPVGPDLVITEISVEVVPEVIPEVVTKEVIEEEVNVCTVLEYNPDQDR